MLGKEEMSRTVQDGDSRLFLRLSGSSPFVARSDEHELLEASTGVSRRLAAPRFRAASFGSNPYRIRFRHVPRMHFPDVWSLFGPGVRRAVRQPAHEVCGEDWAEGSRAAVLAAATAWFDEMLY